MGKYPTRLTLKGHQMTKRAELIEITSKLIVDQHYAMEPTDKFSAGIVDAILSACPELGEPQGFDECDVWWKNKEYLETDKLRLKAFTSNHPVNIDSYYKAASKWFQDEPNRTLAREQRTTGRAQAGKVVVKGLVWTTCKADKKIGIVARSTTMTNVLEYLIVTHGHEFVVWYGGRCLPEMYPTEEAAKAAAQAHHTALTLSNIVGGA